jgi:hypothetical protein
MGDRATVHPAGAGRVITASLIDIDNTLIDNDRAKVVMGEQLTTLLGTDGAARFWTLYEEVRVERTVVDIPHTICRYLQTEGEAGPAGSNLKALHRELAAVFMAFPFEDYIFPGVFELIAALRQRGPVVILSDGDQIYQPTKINRSGLAAAAGGYVLVFPHKEERLADIAAIFPADRYLLIEDKPSVIECVTARAHELGAPLETVFVRQGKYARTVPDGRWPGADHTVEAIAALGEVSLHR